jgi:nucleoside-diphosphate-sugar epimerase
MSLAEAIRDVDHLEQLLSDPTQAAIDAMTRLPGDLVVLGVNGKMGPTLARMAVRASQAGGVTRRVIGVSRFPSADARAALERHGVETIACDLLDERALAALPDAALVVYMAGRKFGSTGNASATWAMNTWLAGLVCRRFSASRIAAFSTGNVYGLAPVGVGGSRESDTPAPVGEYAMSCLGRERLFEHFSREQGTKVAIIRLNYAVEMRYGVLVDLAARVRARQPIDVRMGYCNVIWQGDANAMALAALDCADSPPAVFNVAGPEELRVRDLCLELGQRLGIDVAFTGDESGDAILSDGSRACTRFGVPRVGVPQLLDWTADWVRRDGGSLGKPTHFESREGAF